jgi:hypothetical protein
LDLYFEVCLYLLLLTGFGTLASTGGLDGPTTVLVTMALAARGILLARRAPFKIAEAWTTYLTLGYAFFYLAEYFVLNHGFLRSTVHLVLFVMGVRMFSAQKERDGIMLAVLSFLMVLAAAVLTVDTVFLFCFAAFLVVAVATFALMEMRHTRTAATVAALDPRGQISRPLGRAMAGSAPVVAAAILVMAAAIFFLLPRASERFLGTFAPNADFSTGFSDRVELGTIGRLQQSNAPVMHVQIEGDHRGTYDLKWRGVTLSLFDGRVWSNPLEQSRVPRLADGRFSLSANTATGGAVAAREQHLVSYTVVMEPIGSRVFFLAPQPWTLEGPYRALTIDRGGAVFDVDDERPVGRYVATSDLATPETAVLRQTGDQYSPAVLLTYLELPPLDLRVARLAEQLAATASNNYDRAAAIESYLKSNFAYTLELPQRRPRDPVADFLFERKRGHCEYFASAMAVMLRSLRIPARVVNGFRGGEFNALTGSYVVRARNAHSWVEVYFPGQGWVAFDPTPPSGVLNEPLGRAGLYFDALSSFWREWVVDFDSSHQRSLGHDASQQGQVLAQAVHSWAERFYTRVSGWATSLEADVSKRPAWWGAVGGALGVALALLINVNRLLRAWRRRRLTVHPEAAPRAAAALWYQRALKMLERTGWKKAPQQSAAEFARSVAPLELRMRVTRFTECYESARFGESEPAARRLPELYEELKESIAK